MGQTCTKIFRRQDCSYGDLSHGYPIQICRALTWSRTNGRLIKPRTTSWDALTAKRSPLIPCLARTGVKCLVWRLYPCMTRAEANPHSGYVSGSLGGKHDLNRVPAWPGWAPKVLMCQAIRRALLFYRSQVGEADIDAQWVQRRVGLQGILLYLTYPSIPINLPLSPLWQGTAGLLAPRFVPLLWQSVSARCSPHSCGGLISR